MSNWRELGVIPDSEDEGDDFDDDETLPLPPTPIPVISSKSQYADDIWDVPESDDDGQDSNPILNAPPLSGPNVRNRPQPEPTSISFAIIEDTPQNQVEPSPLSSPGTSSHFRVPTFNEVDSCSSQSAEDVCSSAIGDATTSGTNGIAVTVPTLSTSYRPLATSEDNDVRHCHANREDTGAKPGHRRSLRPRTLIQEHPYAIDHARHSNDFRQHGLIPVKTPVDTENNLPLGASQDGDFDLDSQDNDLPQGTDNTEFRSFTTSFREQHMPDVNSTCSIALQPSDQIVSNSSACSPMNAADDDAYDQDLPDLNQLLNRTSHNGETNNEMQQATQLHSLTQRIRRRDIIYSDSPEPSTTVGQIPRSSSPFTERSDSANQQIVPNQANHQQSYSPKLPSGPVTSTSVVSVSSQELDSQNGHDQNRQRENSEIISESRSDIHQVVTEFSRHIRGVLPASWLRLDQQTGRNSSHRSPKRKTQHRPPNQQRRGVAITKTVAPSSTALDKLSMKLREESFVRYPTDDMSEHQSKIASLHAPSRENDAADENSSLEEDPMIPVVLGSKRQLQVPKTSKRDRKRAKVSSGSRSQVARSRSRQQMITGFITSGPEEMNESLTAGHLSNDILSSDHGYASSINKPTTSSKFPLSLSILDTIEPNAPRFIRIAARSAKQTMNQGRSTLQRKSIKLATRQDQIDAISIMEKWKSGLIAQRPSVSAASKPNPRRRQKANIDQERSRYELISRTTFGTPRGISRKFIKCRDEGGVVSYQRNQASIVTNNSSKPTIGETSHLPSPALREAQLEVDERIGEAIITFRSRKRALDRIFNKQVQRNKAWRLAGNDNALALSCGVPKPHIAEHEPSRIFQGQAQRAKQTRLRKSTKPRRIDVTAPQYTHAADPLPVNVPILTNDAPPEKSKLYGLGPYGTRYTHHFEIFPLIPEVQFHKSTILGSGVLKSFLVDDSHTRTSSPDTQISVRLGDQIFIWGSWNPKVSSEIGVLFDLIAERLEDGQEINLHDGRHAVDAVHSILKYVKDVLDSLDPELQMPPLIPRLQEVFRSFVDRVKSGLVQTSFNDAAHRHFVLKILDRVLLTSSVVTKHCQATPQLIDEHPNAEQTMYQLAHLMISILLYRDVSQVRQIYENFTPLNYSSRILGERAVEMHSWTLLIKVFERTGSRQVSFWNTLEAVVLKPHILSGADAREFEHVWEIVFTLLPLFDFDDTGKIATQKGRNTGNEGWSIPQKLIRRIFQLYQENDQQTASFNNYCRALISRCHYLVQQWGWLRSASVVGVIFDFFGSRRLAHLRNEEVYRSPHFLENLAEGPVLKIEEDEYCFHIFLKLLATSIKNLAQFGSEKDIRNLITRTIPNHSRLYLKEHRIHERDLAALRNHHDLIGTLFWAAPPDVRPSVALIEGLINPANSHKEACLINIRSWAQLARFVVSSGETRASFKPFSRWRNTFFQQMLTQFDGIETDIQQQYLTLSKDKSSFITQTAIELTISKNQAAVMDILHLSLTASSDVMRCAPDLEAATHCLNTLHLEQLFKYFTVSPSQLDWSILRVTLSILDTFLLIVEKFRESQQSQQTESQILDSAQADDAFLILEQYISRTYFSMARCVLSLPTETSSLMKGAMVDKTWCIRQIIVLSARMGMGFINSGLLKLSDMFKAGKYCLFHDQMHTMDPSHRQHFALFISTLLEHGFEDFHDVEFGIFEVWVLSLAMPLKYLKFGNLIGIQRHCFVKGFIPNNMTELITQPSYKTNQLLFEFAVMSMRKTIRRAEPRLRRTLDQEYSKTLKLVMRHLRDYLSLMYGDTLQHQRYVTFVQHVVSAIKAHASDICTIDNFFLQVSREYSPPIQDSQLQIAGMLSYGIRIDEGDPRAAHELFFLLFNNFKHALVNGNLMHDVRKLQRGMKHRSLLAFVLGRMLPAILRVSFTDSSSFALLDVYTKALRLLLSGRILPRQLDNNDLPHVAITIRAIVEGIRIMRLGNGVLSNSQVHILRQALAILNILWPSLLVIEAETPEDASLTDITATLRHIASFAAVAQGYLTDITEMGSGSLDVDLLFEGLDVNQPLTFDLHVNGFTRSIRDDIARSWVFGPTRISIQMPTKVKEDEQESLGILKPTWAAEELAFDLYNQIQNWLYIWQEYS
ncbi:Mus7/MMS22 family domain-containing protein [Trichoderma chlorosporum]